LHVIQFIAFWKAIVDNINDSVVEYANQGTDTVQSSITYTLSDNIENLALLDFSKAEKGQVDGEAVLVYGFPKRNELASDVGVPVWVIRLAIEVNAQVPR
jgi:hypothetical protein